jgi:hypothetical protein
MDEHGVYPIARQRSELADDARRVVAGDGGLAAGLIPLTKEED